eukprot:414119-Prymnesium_polylepis.2
MKRTLRPFVVEAKPAFILSDTRLAMYADFTQKQPSIKLSYSQYKKTLKEIAWNLKKAYRSTCLDRVDVKYRWHREALLVVALLLKAKLAPSQSDADDGDCSEEPPDELMWERIPPLLTAETYRRLTRTATRRARSSRTPPSQGSLPATFGSPRRSGQSVASISCTPMTTFALATPTIAPPSRSQSSSSTLRR